MTDRQTDMTEIITAPLYGWSKRKRKFIS